MDKKLIGKVSLTLFFMLFLILSLIGFLKANLEFSYIRRLAFASGLCLCGVYFYFFEHHISRLGFMSLNGKFKFTQFGSRVFGFFLFLIGFIVFITLLIQNLIKF